MPTLADFIPLIVDTFGHEPTEFQKSMWTQILRRHNVLGLGKTGCGKMMVFEGLGLLRTVLVISPLKALIIKQGVPVEVDLTIRRQNWLRRIYPLWH